MFKRCDVMADDYRMQGYVDASIVDLKSLLDHWLYRSLCQSTSRMNSDCK